eukprot:809952-Amphidinium_carterae.1
MQGLRRAYRRHSVQYVSVSCSRRAHNMAHIGAQQLQEDLQTIRDDHSKLVGPTWLRPFQLLTGPRTSSRCLRSWVD